LAANSSISLQYSRRVYVKAVQPESGLENPLSTMEAWPKEQREMDFEHTLKETLNKSSGSRRRLCGMSREKRCRAKGGSPLIGSAKANASVKANLRSRLSEAAETTTRIAHKAPPHAGCESKSRARFVAFLASWRHTCRKFSTRATSTAKASCDQRDFDSQRVSRRLIQCFLKSSSLNSASLAEGHGHPSAARSTTKQPSAHDRFRRLLVAFACCFYSVVSLALPGDVDPTWNGSGQTINAIGSGDALAHGLVTGSDGRVYQVGACRIGAAYHFCVIRYTVEGKLDLSWNHSGRLISPIGSGESDGRAITLDPDGNVFVAGACKLGSDRHYCVAKYAADGKLDTSWNGTGYTVTVVGAKSSYAQAIALQADGRVLVTGACRVVATVDEYCTLRYNADGELDTSWGDAGIVVTPLSMTSDNLALAIAVQSDGRILVAGHCETISGVQGCTVRYRADGSLDRRWGGTGIVLTSVGPLETRTNSIVVEKESGKVTVAGYCYGPDGGRFCSARYLKDGVLDLTWSEDGLEFSDFNFSTFPITNNFANTIVLQPDGKLLQSGYCGTPSGFAVFCVVRYTPFGVLDGTWSSDGIAMTPIGSSFSYSRGMGFSAGDRVVLGGTCVFGGVRAFCTVRYEGGTF
jgi:uncharacterized delta-60 repeat protein